MAVIYYCSPLLEPETDVQKSYDILQTTSASSCLIQYLITERIDAWNYFIPSLSVFFYPSLSTTEESKQCLRFSNTLNWNHLLKRHYGSWNSQANWILTPLTFKKPISWSKRKQVKGSRTTTQIFK